MHLVPLTPPAHGEIFSGFDYVTADAQSARQLERGRGDRRASTDVPEGVHTLALDDTTAHIWIVWDDPKGDFIQGCRCNLKSFVS
ncbi:MAG: hypothetical protein M3T49_08645 [Candidatus Eremiobacteraeota bacterium]|nr:hypothetical protein [Candidatus Eremiobacteraeota bacterium]